MQNSICKLENNILTVQHNLDSDPTVSYIEFVMYKNTFFQDSYKITVSELSDYEYELNQDGLFNYFCLKVYNFPQIDVDNKLIQKDNQLYVGQNGELVLITDFTDLFKYEVLDKFESEVFNLYNLEKCVLNYKIHKRENELNCDVQIDIYKEFLLISEIILKELLLRNKLFEAQTILDDLNTCNKLCIEDYLCVSDTVSNVKNCLECLRRY